MIYQGTEELVWQADTNVSVFQSGLILVQRSAIVPKHRADNARPSLQVGDLMPIQNDPSIDGVFIFPEPQETSSATHVTFLVSGYGRVSTQTTEVESQKVSDFNNSPALFNIITQKSIVREAEETVFLFPKKQVSIQYLTSYTTYTTHLGGQWKVASFQRDNYGAFDELTISYEAFV
jgi:hypothetical protein